MSWTSVALPAPTVKLVPNADAHSGRSIQSASDAGVSPTPFICGLTYVPKDTSTGLRAVLNAKVPRTGSVPASFTPISTLVTSWLKLYPSSTLISKVFAGVEFAAPTNVGSNVLT